jgi:hypothetical protein
VTGAVFYTHSAMRGYAGSRSKHKKRRAVSRPPVCIPTMMLGLLLQRPVNILEQVW